MPASSQSRQTSLSSILYLNKTKLKRVLVTMRRVSLYHILSLASQSGYAKKIINGATNDRLHPLSRARGGQWSNVDIYKYISAIAFNRNGVMKKYEHLDDGTEIESLLTKKVFFCVINMVGSPKINGKYQGEDKPLTWDHMWHHRPLWDDL